MKSARLIWMLAGIYFLFAVSVVSQTLAQPSFDPHSVGRAITAQEHHTDALLNIPSVVGTAVGLGQDGQPVVKIYVEKKGVANLPNQLDGVPVVVQETGPIYAHPKSNTKANRAPSVSITNPTAGATYSSGAPINFQGTATDREDGNISNLIQWFLDGATTYFDTGSSVSYFLADGAHTVIAKVTDSGGKSASASVNFTVGNATSSVDPTARFNRPVPIGVSTGNKNYYSGKGGLLYCSAGTLGARLFVNNNGTSSYYALSNNHLYANEGQAAIGDDIVQPGDVDNNPVCAQKSQDVIGELFEFVPIVFSRSASNVVDAAIASVTDLTVGKSTPSDGYGAPKSGFGITPLLDQSVQKYGRTTSLTHGKVTGINVTVLVRYDSGTARFINQFEITPNSGSFSDSGDSGSLIVAEGGNDNLKPVGLLFAGGSSVTFANPIGAVLSGLVNENSTALSGLQVDGN